MQRSHKLISLIAIALFAAGRAVSAEPLRIGGTGSAIETMRFLGAKLASADESQFEIIPTRSFRASAAPAAFVPWKQACSILRCPAAN
jgi:hypothetical protein